MYYIGLDPGKTGAMTIFSHWDEYPVAILNFKKHDTPYKLAMAVAYTIKATLIFSEGSMCYIEHVHARPTDSRRRAFTFGRYTGILEGVLGAIDVTSIQISPQKWKKRFGLINSSLTYPQKKKAAKEKVLELFPELPKYPMEVYDSILIAYHMKQDGMQTKEEED